jgi:hypothetical protein
MLSTPPNSELRSWQIQFRQKLGGKGKLTIFFTSLVHGMDRHEGERRIVYRRRYHGRAARLDILSDSRWTTRKKYGALSAGTRSGAGVFDMNISLFPAEFSFEHWSLSLQHSVGHVAREMKAPFTEYRNRSRQSFSEKAIEQLIYTPPIT